MRAQFWTLPLTELTHQEWEGLCDGCGKCCLHKLEDEADGAVYYTAIACEQLDLNSCRCTNYAARAELVPDCIDIRNGYQGSSYDLSDLPASCSYRLRAQDQQLPDWHPLICGENLSIHSHNKSVQGKVLSAANVHEDEFEDHIIRWIEL